MRGTSRKPGRAFPRALASCALALAAALALVACGGDDGGGQFEDEKAGDYDVAVVSEEFPERMRLAETEDLVLGLRNTGDRTVPAMTVVVSLLGRGSDQGTQQSVGPFTYYDPQPGLSIHQRPAFLLEEGYPKLAGQTGQGGAQTANNKTFNFGPVKPGESIEAIWRVSAIEAGDFTIGYEVRAGLAPDTKAVGSFGGAPEGELDVRVIERPQKMRVNGRGEIVPVGSGRGDARETQPGQ